MATNRSYGDNAVQVKSMTVGDKRRWVAVEHERDSCLGSIYIHLLPDVCYEVLVNSITFNSSQHSKSLPKKVGRNMKKFKSNTRHSVITAEHLVQKMNIGLEKYEQIMRAKSYNVLRLGCSSSSKHTAVVNSIHDI